MENENTQIEMSEIMCPDCGALFAIPTLVFERRKTTNKPLYCPNGDVIQYTGESASDKFEKEIAHLEKEVADLITTLNNETERHQQEKRSATESLNNAFSEIKKSVEPEVKVIKADTTIKKTVPLAGGPARIIAKKGDGKIARLNKEEFAEATKNLIKELPKNFSTADAVAIGSLLGLSQSSVYRTVSKSKQIKKGKAGVYIKVTKVNNANAQSVKTQQVINA